MRIHWRPEDLQDPFVRTIAETVLARLDRADSPEDADLVLHPHDVHGTLDCLLRIQSGAKQAKSLGRKLLVFQVSDSSMPIPVPNTVVFRTSMLRSRRLPNEHVLPYLWESITPTLLEELGRPRPGLTTIGFCGCPHTHPVRMKVIRELPSMLPCRFLLRDRFWGGAPHDPTLIREFFDNILATDLTLAIRGAGNFSIRFYQSLSCGRVPLLIDTDGVLPYEGLDPLPWEDLIVRVEARQLDAIASAVDRFRERTEGDAGLEARVRQFHRDCFTPAGFAAHLIRHREHYLG